MLLIKNRISLTKSELVLLGTSVSILLELTAAELEKNGGHSIG